MRASDRAYSTLRSEIVEWMLPPGTVLGEVEQAERLGVSRTPLREALSRLVADGLVAPQAGRGLVVTDISIDNIRELFEVRRALEEQAARLAAERADRALFATLEEEFHAAPALLTGDDPKRRDYYDLVARFDDAIDASVANPYLVTALRSLRTHLVRIRRLSRDDAERLRAAASEHLLIVHAIRLGDPDLAAHATHVHLHHALTSALASARGVLRPAEAERIAP
ncbi:GntR family transcriptional regulator [Salinibacterium sp. SYSU T00001]|uniref:GntR family transcriptional regulator n=1 Tax=Homoserinimonas sedimenticola TaxID=2986805 RepID=UPI0022362F6A|nr:GntR family transcriptional regulator [Salinibacterium sedimenticola]MCW4386372.1 GntR family transcriptional regulator [Salinibacterium sedimenticola]